jgi:hypothetical protein
MVPTGATDRSCAGGQHAAAGFGPGQAARLGEVAVLGIGVFGTIIVVLLIILLIKKIL